MINVRRALWPVYRIRHADAVFTRRGAGAARALSTAGAPPVLPKLSDEVQQEPTGLAQAVGKGRRTVIGIDPDNGGAIAVVRLGRDVGANDMLEALAHVEVEIHDMPLEKISVGKRERNQAAAPAVIGILSAIMATVQDRTEVHAVLEQPVPNPMNGVYSLFGTAYAYGLWTGLVAYLGVEMETVSARRWKQDLGLNKQGKDGSRALALALFPSAEPLLKRKKDHGRAEALLIVAWALGIRVPPTSKTAEKLAVMA